MTQRKKQSQRQPSEAEPTNEQAAPMTAEAPPSEESQVEVPEGVEALVAAIKGLSAEDREKVLADYGIRVPGGDVTIKKYGYYCSCCGELALEFIGSEPPPLNKPAVGVPISQGDFQSDDPAKPQCRTCRVHVRLDAGCYNGDQVVEIEKWRKKKAAAAEATKSFFDDNYESVSPERARLANALIAAAGESSGLINMRDVHDASHKASGHSIDDVRNLVATLDERYGFTKLLLSSKNDQKTVPLL